jgi:hypothetical protein
MERTVGATGALSILRSLGWIGGRALQRVIDAISDSNDDFIFF